MNSRPTRSTRTDTRFPYPTLFRSELEPQAGSAPRCGRCGQLSPLIHERRIRLVRDRDLFDQRVLLQLPVRRVDCLNCGRVTERIDWLRSEEHTSELQSLMRIAYAVFCLEKKLKYNNKQQHK